MLRYRNIDRICAIITAVTMLLAVAITALAAGGGLEGRETAGYEQLLFDTSTVHTLDIVIDDWDGFLETCTSEKYTLCSVVIDGERLTSVAIRGKGNTSLSSVAQYGNNRYSFKLEFDHYQAGKSYHGLDKLCLNNLIQDKTCMKDYLAYTLMRKNGVAAPLCSFVRINVNGEYWGLYLAVEAVEDAFMTRNYGSATGDVYKPDSSDMGGGKGFGGDFRMSQFREKLQNPEDFTPPEREEGPQGGGMGADDVKLKYTDDDPESYTNIFENAKTDVTDADKARLIAAIKALNEGENIENTVDVEAVIRYFVVHSFLVNGDSYTGSMIHNYYLYENGGVLSMIPWDYNLSLGAFSMSQNSDADSATAAVNDPIDTPVSGGDVTDRPMLAWIFADENYTDLYHQIYAEFMADICDSGWLAEEIDRVSAMIAPYVETDPTAFFTYEEFKQGVETLKTFVDLRAQSVEGQLSGDIPATTAAQTADASALIDASAIDLSDMGEMAGGGGGPGSHDGDGPRPEMPTDMDADRAMPSPPEDFPQMPGDMDAGSKMDTEALPLGIASLILLIAGLVFAQKSRLCR